MKKLQNLVQGAWVEGSGEGQTLVHAITGQPHAIASSDGIDIESMYAFARDIGSPGLRGMTFQERGRMLKRLALHLHAIKETFYEVSWATGATRGPIHGSTLKAALATSLPTPVCDASFPTRPSRRTEILFPWAKRARLAGTTCWFPNAGWPCTSTRSTSLYGACWKNVL